MMQAETFGILPFKNAVLWQNIGVIDGTVANTVGMHVIIVAYHHINAALEFALFESIQERGEILAHLVVAVYHLKIDARCVLGTLVDALSVSAVLLVNDLNNGGIFCHVFVGNGTCCIGGTVVDNDDLHTFATNKKAIYTASHIGLRIITRNCNRQ